MSNILLEDLLSSLSLSKIKLIVILSILNKSDEEIEELLKNNFKENNKEEKNNGYYTSKEICEIFKISSSTLDRWILKGLVCKCNGRKTKRLFTVNDVNDFINKKK